MNFEEEFYGELDKGLSFEEVGKIISYAFINSTEGDPESVLKAMDEYNPNTNWCTNMENPNSHISKRLVEKNKPKVVVELGGYYGYSTILLASLLKDDPEARVYSIELDPLFACVIDKTVSFSGLEEKVTILSGTLSQSISKLKALLKKNHNRETVDLLLINHDRDSYLADFKLAESHGLFYPGTIIAADGVLSPVTSNYFQHVQSHKNFVSEILDVTVDYNGEELIDAIMVSVCK